MPGCFATVVNAWLQCCLLQLEGSRIKFQILDLGISVKGHRYAEVGRGAAKFGSKRLEFGQSGCGQIPTEKLPIL